MSLADSDKLVAKGQYDDEMNSQLFSLIKGFVYYCRKHYYSKLVLIINKNPYYVCPKHHLYHYNQYNISVIIIIKGITHH